MIAQAADPPANIAKLVAAKEAEAAAERANYTYRQTMIFEERPQRGKPGMYREVRDVVFSPAGERSEKTVEGPHNNLNRLRLTPEDFRDIYEVQSLLFTPDLLFLYEVKPRGEENMDGRDCWVLQVRPRQILSEQRLFEGMFWVDQATLGIIRAEGRPLPQIRSTRPGKENLFPHFTTVREQVGEHWFPVHTHADDTLDFNTGPLRVKITVRYRDYKKFGADSRVLPE